MNNNLIILKKYYPARTAHYPDDSSIKTAFHYLQRAAQSNFARYDYGKLKNMKIYGTKMPPSYNLSFVTCDSIVLMSGVNDLLADVADVNRLRQDLRGELT